MTTTTRALDHAMPAAREAVRPRDLSTRAPFRSSRGERRADATIRGEIPDWLRGDLVRTTPATFVEGTWEAHHWFDALGMLYGFRVGDAGVTYRQRPMSQTQVAQGAHEGRASTASFGTPLQRGFWARLFQPVPPVTDNANVNVVALGDERVAMTESPHQWAVDPDTLELTRTLTYTDDVGDVAMIAHPHMDFETGRIVSLATRFGMKSEIVVYEHAPNERTRRIVGRIPAARMPYVHGFGLTARHAIVIGHPFDVAPWRVLWSNRGFADHFEYRPDAGTTLWLVDRATGAVRTHHAPSGFVFHVVNAFEDGDATTIDVAMYPDASVVSGFRSDAIAADGLPDLVPSIVRWTMREGAREAKHEVLHARGFEFPSISYRRVNGKRHDVAWGARVSERGTAGEIVRFDGAGERTFAEAGFVFGEPIFVARPKSEREDDGVIVTVGSHVESSRSAMAVLDARSLEVRAWAEIPLSIPLGFHGSFFRD